MPLYLLKGNFLWLLVFNIQTENVKKKILSKQQYIFSTNCCVGYQ